MPVSLPLGACVEARGQLRVARSVTLHIFFFRQGLSLSKELTVLARLAGQ